MPNEPMRSLRFAAMMAGCLALVGCGGGATGLERIAGHLNRFP